MKTILRSLFFFIVIATISLWVTLQTHEGQAWCKKIICETVKEKSQFELSIGKITGVPPFILSFENVELLQVDSNAEIPWEKKLFHAGSISVVPNWFSVLFGKPSLLYLGLSDLNVSEITPSKQQEGGLFPTQSVVIWYFSAKGVHLPEKYQKPFLNDLYKEVDVNLLYSLRGNLHYDGDAKRLKATLKASPTIGDTAPFHFDLKAAVDEKECKITLTADAHNPPSGSAFIQLPCDELNARMELVNMKGSWQLSGMKRKETKTIFPEGIRFTMKGEVDIPSFESYSFVTTELQCQEFLTRQFDTDENRFPEHEVRQIPVDGILKVNITITDQIALSIDSDSFALNDQHVSPLKLALLANPCDDGWKGTVSLQATVNRLPVNASCNWASDTMNRAAVRDIMVSIANTKFSGGLDISFYPLQLKGKIQSKPSEFGPILSLCGIEANAKASFSCIFTPDELSQKIDAHLLVEHITSNSLVLEKAICKVTSRDTQFDLNLDVQNFANKQVTIDNAHLLLNNSTVSCRLAGQGKNSPFSFIAKGSYSPSSFSLETCDAVVGKTKIALANPCTWKATEGTFSLIQNDKNVVTLDYNKKASEFYARTSLVDFPLELLDPFFDISLFGTTSGQIELFGVPASPKLHIGLATSDLTFSPRELVDCEPLMATLQLDFADSLCDVQAELQGLSIKKPLTAHIKLPLKLSFAPYTLTYEPKGALSGSITGELEIEPLFASYMEDDETVTGRVAIDAHIAGTAETPDVLGTCYWQDGSLLLPGIGCSLSSIQSHLELKGNKAQLIAFHAEDDMEGKISMTGDAELSLIDGLRYTVDAHLQKYEIVKRDEAEVTATGKLLFTGTEKDAKLSGSITVDQAKLTLSPHVNHEIPKVDVTYEIKNKEPYFFSKESIPIALNLDVTIPESGKLVGMGLDSLWKGHLHATGSASELRLEGNVTACSGVFHFADKAFIIKQGTVDFRGDLFSQSYLNLIASHEVQEVLTEIVLKGPLADPKILFQSNPAMKEKEILSWILFNKSAAEISPIQGLQLAQTLLKLRGTATGLDVIEKLKETLGIDRIDFGSSTSVAPKNQNSGNMPNEVSFQIGKYISDGVIVTLSKDVTNEVNRVGVTAELAKYLNAEAYVGDDAETELALRFKYRY